MYKLFFKRILDFFIAIALFTLLFPIFLVVTIGLFITNKGNAFFVQKRPGKNEIIFKIIKFKSMNDKTDDDGKLLPNEQRITVIGKLIRKTSIDEIPQLLNVIKGDMSLIGPRPLKMDYLNLYSSTQKRRHDVRPGITGWAQVNGRNAISHTEKFAYDVWYVDNHSFTLDVKVLLLTVLKVFKKEGVSQSGVNQNVPFNGLN